MDTVAKIGQAFAVNLKPATPILIRDAGLLAEGEWAAVDKAIASAATAAAKDKAAAAAGSKKAAGKAAA